MRLAALHSPSVGHYTGNSPLVMGSFRYRAMSTWLRVSARAGSAWTHVVRLLDTRDGPQLIIGIERASTRLGADLTAILLYGLKAPTEKEVKIWLKAWHGRGMLVNPCCTEERGEPGREEASLERWTRRPRPSGYGRRLAVTGRRPFPGLPMQLASPGWPQASRARRHLSL